ncbi:MAG: hypothetical protein ACUVS4_11125 [Chloroflexaceae bacterium]
MASPPTTVSALRWNTPGRRLLLAVTLGVIPASLVAPVGRLGVAMALVLLAPGYLIERRLTPSQPALVRLSLWLALSLSLVPLAYQWLHAAGVALGAPGLWLATALLAGATLVCAWHDLGATPDPGPAPAGMRQANALTAILFALTLWTRFVQIEGLAFPPWVDPLHHALLIRVAAETGMAPLSLEPYLPVRELPYHWGYHVTIATLLRLSGMDLPGTLLFSGQILNALNVLTTAGLALALWRRPLAAPVAALIVGLVSLMPAYYLSWGRYTQLAGLLMLPALVIAWNAALHLHQRGQRWWLTVALCLAGLNLVHVRMLIFGLLLLAALGLVWAAGRPWAALRARLPGALAAVVGAVALTIPWLALIINRALLPAAAAGELAGGGSYNALNENLLWIAPNRLLVALALGGGLLALWRRVRAGAVLLIWVGLLALATNPWLLGYALPAAGAVALINGLLGRAPLLALAGVALLLLNPATVTLPYFWLLPNDVLVISLFLPLALLIGGGAALALYWLEAASPRLRPFLIPATTVAVLALGLRGAHHNRSVINPVTLLVRPGEPAALTWAAAETPPDARFLVNAAPWLPGARRGADGGWWLLPLAGRWTSAPPVVYVHGPPEYVAHVNAVADTVIGYTPGQEQAIFDLIRTEGITHIYLVEGSGPLQAGLFAGRPGFVQVYGRDGVTIFAVEDVRAGR